MAVNPLSPGVYIDELSVFPASVAPVATAIPAFIGYTEKGPTMEATRITSMIEFEQIFGGAFHEPFGVTLDTSPAITIDDSNLSEYTLHYNLRMYFANGGGPCYIVSVDSYDLVTPTVDANLLITGIAATERTDEVTLLVVPEAVASDVSSPQRSAIHSAMLDLCQKLKDRFSIMDVITGTGTITSDAAAFRNTETGANNLKYGAAYYPSLETLLTRFYVDNEIDITDDRGGAGLGPFEGLKLSDILSGVSATATITIGAGISNGDTVVVNGVTYTGAAANNPLTGAFLVGTPAVSATNLSAMINANATTSLIISASPSGSNVIVTAKVAGSTGNSYTLVGSADIAVSSATLLGGINPDKVLYNDITTALQAYTMRLYPSATMAGIYASVDRDRGVWKAPANVSINGVVTPTLAISSADQENLNIDAGSGKSINAIRAFAGKGILVWGARTLAGNDNEWRYVPVRRLFIFVEESIQEASEFVVFEPNDKNTWTRVKSLISNFLTNLWRDGALAGATPDEAFFVRVGLGETMTAQDILEGKMTIQVGLAAVRPAEFIILQFSHKLQES